MDQIHRALQAIAKAGFTPGGIIDIGASNGCETRHAWEAWPDCPALLIEPGKKWNEALNLFEKENGDKARVVRSAVGDTSMKWLASPHGNPHLSYMTNEPNATCPMEYQAVTTRDLRDVLREHHDHVKPPYYIKIDVQGCQMPILRQLHELREVARRADVVGALLIESCGVFKPNGDDSATIEECMARAHDWGMRLWTIDKAVNRSYDKQLWEVDLLFVLDEPHIMKPYPYPSYDVDLSCPFFNQD